jgi:hypothetical protein
VRGFGFNLGEFREKQGVWKGGAPEGGGLGVLGESGIDRGLI